MPSIQGIAVDILQPDRDNEVAEARYDKDSRTLKAFRGEIESGFICVPAGERIAVLINFTQPGFTPYSARGMRVIISIARATKEDTQEHGQTWWIPKKCFGTSNEDKGHDFSEVTEFNEDGSVVEVKPRKAPTPAELPDMDGTARDVTLDREPLEWQLDGVPHKGCILVTVQRGHLVDSSAAKQSSESRRPSYPHEGSRDGATDGVKIIDPAWFKRMRGDNGDACHWEFRNVNDLSLIAKYRPTKAHGSPEHWPTSFKLGHKAADPWRQLQESLKLFPDPPSDREILGERLRRVREARLTTDHGDRNPDSDDSDDSDYSISTSESTESDAEISDSSESESEKLLSPAFNPREEEGVRTPTGTGATSEHTITTAMSTDVSLGGNPLRGDRTQTATSLTSVNLSETSVKFPDTHEPSECKHRKTMGEYSRNKHTMKERPDCEVSDKQQRSREDTRKSKAALARMYLRPDHLEPSETEREVLVTGEAEDYDDNSIHGEQHPSINVGVLASPPSSTQRSAEHSWLKEAPHIMSSTGPPAPSIPSLAMQSPGACDPRKQSQSLGVIDLTQDDEVEFVVVKRENTSDVNSASKKRKITIEERESPEDLQDLEDQLLEVGLRRKIRAIKQRQAKSVKIEV